MRASMLLYGQRDSGLVPRGHAHRASSGVGDSAPLDLGGHAVSEGDPQGPWGGVRSSSNPLPCVPGPLHILGLCSCPGTPVRCRVPPTATLTELELPDRGQTHRSCCSLDWAPRPLGPFPSIDLGVGRVLTRTQTAASSRGHSGRQGTEVRVEVGTVPWATSWWTKAAGRADGD